MKKNNMEITVNNIKYQLDIKNKTAKVIGYLNDPNDIKIPEYVEYENEKYKVTEIGKCTFVGCSSLTSFTIPYSVTSIGNYAFAYCTSLTSVNIPNSVTEIGEWAFRHVGLKLPKRYTEDGRLIAYKAFRTDMSCRKFQYEEGKTFEIEGEIKCCECGFHACTNPLDIFNYYWGTISTDIYIHEVYLSGDIDDDNDLDSKVCASKIEIGRRLKVKDINEIINSK